VSAIVAVAALTFSAAGGAGVAQAAHSEAINTQP
jgi:hypothetical protein